MMNKLKLTTSNSKKTNNKLLYIYIYIKINCII